MIKPTKGHFHCVECGALFRAKVVSSVNQRCPVCGNPPTGRMLAPASQLDVKSVANTQLKGAEPVKHTKRKEKRSKSLFVILGVWILLMALTVGGVKYFAKEENVGTDVEALAEQERLQLEVEKKQAMRFVKDAMPECQQTITEFFNATSAGAKAQFVYKGRELATEMSRYYTRNPTFSATRSQVKIRSANLLKNTQNQTIAAFCINAQGEAFEAIFVRSEGAWKIDWMALVRFDSRSWSLFPSGNDGDEGEFRLYMRVRDSNKELNAGVINLVFYKPETYLKGEFRGIPSSTVSVASDSDAGRLIVQLVEEEAEAKEDAFGNAIDIIDPPSYHRVRVKLKLHKEESETRLELIDILASHWYGDDVVISEEEIEDKE